MNVELVIQDSQTGAAYNISELLLETRWQTSLLEQPGKLTFSYINDPNILFPEGSIVSFKIDNIGVFFGYVFKRGKTKDEKIVLTAYDQMRYLKNKDTYKTADETASQVFSKICSKFSLRSSVVASSSYKMAPYLHDNKTLYEIIQRGIDETLVNTGIWYVVYDDFGTLKFNDLQALRTSVYIGDNYLLTNYNFESSIDEDTYNQVKIMQNDNDEPKIVFNAESIARWGVLQYFEKVDEKANAAQISARAEMLLKIKNRATKKLRLSCLGNLNIRAGSGIVLGVSALEQEGIVSGNYFIVTSCEHVFKNDLHTMELEVQMTV